MAHAKKHEEKKEHKMAGKAKMAAPEHGKKAVKEPEAHKSKKK